MSTCPLDRSIDRQFATGGKNKKKTMKYDIRHLPKTWTMSRACIKPFIHSFIPSRLVRWGVRCDLWDEVWWELWGEVRWGEMWWSDARWEKWDHEVRGQVLCRYSASSSLHRYHIQSTTEWFLHHLILTLPTASNGDFHNVHWACPSKLLPLGDTGNCPDIDEKVEGKMPFIPFSAHHLVTSSPYIS